MSKPFLSIVVPIYNIEQFLPKCLDSLLTQTSNNYEVILVDDGSTDSSSAICDNYCLKSERFKVLHKSNGGLVSARKAGALISQGEYIACVDGDDWVENNYVDIISSFAKQNNTDIICFNYVRHEGNNNIRISSDFIGFYNKERIIVDIFPILLHSDDATYFSPTIWNKVYKRELYLKIQLQVDDKTTIAEDSACSLPCVYLANSILFIPDSLYNYRKNSLSMTKGHKVFDCYYPKYIAIQLMQTINLKEYDLYDQFNRKICHELFTAILTQFYRKETYNIIVKDINMVLKDPLYVEVLKNCKYKGIKAKMMLFSLKNKLYFVIYIWALIKGEF